MKNPLICLSLILLSIVNGPAADEWPQWRGPDGQGNADAVDLPLHWSATDKVAWHTELPGKGHSSPVISGQQIWITTAMETKASADEAKERLAKNTGGQPLVLLSHVSLRAICIDKDTGKILHNVEVLSLDNPQWVHKLNSYASPTPILREGRLYCHFGALGNACVDTATGKVLWTNSELSVNHENGPGSTPVLWNNLMIFHLDGSDLQLIAALDVDTGKIAWKTDRSGELQENPQLKKSCGTPLILKVDGKDQLISPAADWLYSYDPATGRELWKLRYGKLGFSNVSKPVFGQGMLFLSTGFGKTEMLALKMNGEKAPIEVWRHKKAVPRVSSPVLLGEQLYFISDAGILSCMEAKSGKVQWQERLNGNYSASPIFADGHLFFFSHEGKVHVVAPGMKYQPVAENDMGSPIMASPAAVGNAIYLRAESGLYRIQK